MQYGSSCFSKLAIGLSVMVAAATVTAEAQTLYRVTEIPVEKADYVFPTAINAKGDVVGFTAVGGFLYKNGVVTDLVPALGTGSDPRGINDAGDIAGDYDQGSNAFLYTNNILIDLPTHPNNYWNLVDDLNNAGQVSLHGIIFHPETIEYHASIYTDGKLVKLPTLGGTYARAYSLNDRGHAAGEATDAKEQGPRAIVYREGKTIDLGTLGGVHSRAYDINERGHIVGYSYLPGDETSVAFLYNEDGIGAAKMISLGSKGAGTHSAALGINDLDEIVGSFETTPDNLNPHALYYKDGQLLDLNELVDPRDPLYGQVLLTQAGDINNDGWIIASGRNLRDGTTRRGFLLRPVTR
jgi:probable HAF family extracellular repeat protein